MKVWEIYYKEHFIKVTKGFSQGAILYVDGEIQDFVSGFSLNNLLTGCIKIGNGEGDLIKVRLAMFGKYKCIIFVKNTLLFPNF